MLLRLANFQLNDSNSDTGGFSAIIVPSFSPNDKVRESCRLISSILNTLVVYVNVQYAQKGKNTLEPPVASSPRPTGHGYFYRGKDVDGPDPVKHIFSDGMEPSVTFHPAKNLWYSTRFCYVDRDALAKMASGPNGFSKSFVDIFAANAKVREPATELGPA
jgi:hypothetical protein